MIYLYNKVAKCTSVCEVRGFVQGACVWMKSAGSSKAEAYHFSKEGGEILAFLTVQSFTMYCLLIFVHKVGQGQNFDGQGQCKE